MKIRITILCFSLFFTTFLFSQIRTISGAVTDVHGNPLPGATILIKETPLGTTTDQGGNYSIDVATEYTVLIFNYVGYKAQEVEINDRTIINVTLRESSGILDEVIVVGYGQQIKSKLTGNIAKIDGEDIHYTPVTSLEETLQGKAAGVFIETSNGKLGSEANIQVRGPTSITAANRPLIVVDGIPITTDRYSPGYGPNVNMLTFLNFNDVESVEILKDASATAIYGSRAANGVMLITTKRGSEGPAKIDFNYQSGFSKPTHKREFLNAEQYIDLFHRTAIGAGCYDYEQNPGGWGSKEEAVLWYTDFIDNQLDIMAGHTDWRKLETDTDWQDPAFQDAPMYQADLSFSGGNKMMSYYTSLGFSDQKGIIVGNRYKKYNGRLNLDGELRENLDFGMNFNFSHAINNDVPGDGWFETPLSGANLAPITPIRNLEGELYDQPVTVWYNPLIELENSDRRLKNNNILGNFFLIWNFLPAFSIRGDFGVNSVSIKSNYFTGRRTLYGRDSNGLARLRQRNSMNYNAKAVLDYHPALKKAHVIHFISGYEIQKTTTEIANIIGSEFPVDDLRTLSSAAVINNAWEFTSAVSFLSYFGRLNYEFDGKYLVTLNARYDGSSRFGKNNRYGFFPAASMGWIVSKESFMDKLKTLSFLKIRSSYGFTGNAFIGNFEHLGLFNATRYGGQSGLRPTQTPNPDLKWERTSQWDVGLDFGLFENRINGEIDYYIKKTKGLLVEVPVPSTSGFFTQIENVGEVNNKGIEFVLNTNNLTGKFKWSTSLNFAYNKNTVLKIAEGQDVIDYGFSGNGIKVGYPINSFLLAEYAGVDTDNGDALFYVNSENAEPGATTTNFNEAEKIPLGDSNPDFIGGLTNTFSWNGLSLNIHLQGVFGKEIYSSFDQLISCNACYFDNQTIDQLDAWQNPGDITDVPEPRFWFNNGGQGRSSRYVQDASFIRVKSIGFFYDFPNHLLENWKMRQLTIYLQAQNWFTFTDYKGWDPEANADSQGGGLTGTDFATVPQAKTLTFGVKLGL